MQERIKPKQKVVRYAPRPYYKNVLLHSPPSNIRHKIPPTVSVGNSLRTGQSRKKRKESKKDK